MASRKTSADSSRADACRVDALRWRLSGCAASVRPNARSPDPHGPGFATAVPGTEAGRWTWTLWRALAVSGIETRLDQRAGRRLAVDRAAAAKCRAPPLLAACHRLVTFRVRTDARSGRRTCRKQRAHHHREQRALGYSLHVPASHWLGAVDVPRRLAHGWSARWRIDALAPMHCGCQGADPPVRPPKAYSGAAGGVTVPRVRIRLHPGCAIHRCAARGESGMIGSSVA